MFNLKRPCANCPWTKKNGPNFALNKDRIMDFIQSEAFQCHKTIDYTDNGAEPGERPQQCAGLMALLHREGTPNAIMKLAIMTGDLDPSELDPDKEAFETFSEAFEAHGHDPADVLGGG